MILNETVLSVALPHLMRDPSIDAVAAQWLSTGFMLTMAVIIPTTSFLLQRFRTRTLFTTALALFLAGSLIAAVAPSFSLVLLSSVVQAGGTSIILPLLMGLNAVVISVGPAIGPTLSGLVIDNLGWRWVFGLMLPIAAITLTVRVSVIIIGIAMAVMLGTVMVLPLHLQNGIGIATVVVGLMLLPGGLAQGIIAPVIGRIYDAVGPRPLVIPGAVLFAGGQWWLTTLTTTTPVGIVIAMHVVFSLGMALLMTPLMTASLGSLPREQYGHGSAIVNTIQQLSGAAGIAVMIAAMTVGTGRAMATGADAAAAQVSGTTAAFVVGGILALVALVSAPFVKVSRREELVDVEPERTPVGV